MIHETDAGAFSISSHHVWLPGLYDSRKTARWAFQFEDKVLWELQQMANARNGGKDGVVTRDDLAQCRQEDKSDE